MQFNISFKTIFEYILKKLVLCIQIRFVSTEETTRIASRASCYTYTLNAVIPTCITESYVAYVHITTLCNQVIFMMIIGICKLRIELLR